MINYLDVSDFSLLQVHLAIEKTQNPYSVLQGEPLSITRLKVSNITELHQELSSGGDLFGSSVSSDLLIDIQDLQITPGFITELSQMDTGTTRNIWLFSLTHNVFLTDLKKSWTQAGFSYLQLKTTDSTTKNQIALEYSDLITLSATQIRALTDQATSYTELIDDLDFVSLSDNQLSAYQSLIKETQTPLYMLGFDTTKLTTQLPKWYHQTPDEDVQLAMSLVFTKLEKQSTEASKNLFQKLILTDQSIKTGSKLSQLTRWRLFLYTARVAQ
jgi:hypothetical protein